jgi:hypothetical protein
MHRVLNLLVASCAFSLAVPGNANLLVEATFEQKMAQAELVVIGTVTAANPGGPRREGSTATLDVLRILKGEAGASLTVSTHSRIAEDNLRCCEVGATYIMFLGGRTRDGHMVSVWGQYGMIRIGGPPHQTRVIRGTKSDGTRP